VIADAVLACGDANVELGVSSSWRRCESSAAVALAAAAETAADFAERREYQTAPTDPAAATIETTSAAMTTTVTVMALRRPARAARGCPLPRRCPR
jgi:hypothetical protein